MKISVIGEKIDNLVIVDKYAKDKGYEAIFSGFIGSYLTMQEFIEDNKESEIIILDITKLLCVSDDELSEVLKYVRNNYKGKFVCYNFQRQNDKLASICAKAGVKYFIDAIMAVDVKKQLIQIIEDDRKVNDIRAEGETKDNRKKFSHSPKAEPSEVQIQNNRATMVKTICIIGVMPRIGTTTQAISIVKFLEEHGINACYVEANDNHFIKKLTDNYEDVKFDEHSDAVTYEGVDLFTSDDKTYGREYAYKVIDFGAIKDTIPSEFMYGDICIIVLGVSPDELDMLTSKVDIIYETNAKYIFSFVSEGERKDTLEIMSSARDRVYFAEYRPSAFESVDDKNSNVYKNLLGIELQEDTNKTKKKRKLFGKQR